MFEFGRLFRPATARIRDGLLASDPALLELLDLALLNAGASAADIGAGRASENDRSATRLRQARIWRELARRTADAIALRRAVSAAERVAAESAAYAPAARVEQARCAMLGSLMFGDEGLNAAADRALSEALTGPPSVRAAAIAERAQIAGLQALARDDAVAALAALTGYDAATNILREHPKAASARLALTHARLDRAVLTARCGEALKNDGLLARATADLAEAIGELDPAYHPLTWGRACVARARVLTRMGAVNADVRCTAEAVETVSRVFDVLLKDHSPLDWAAAQAAHGAALWALAEASGVEDAFTKASGAYDRAWSVVRFLPALRDRAAVGERRGALAVRIAVTHSSLLELDAVEAGFRCDLARADPHRDPVGWALCQLNLGRAYLAAAGLGRSARDLNARAGLAIAEAEAIFVENGLEGLAEAASMALAANLGA